MSMSMRDAVIVSVARTPAGKYRQAFAAIEAPKLSAIPIKAAIEKIGLDPAEVDEVIWGNIMNFNWANLARVVALEAGLPIEVPAITIDRQCSSSLNALAYGALLINSGNADVVIAGGVESYSQRPIMIKNPPIAYPNALEVTRVTGPAGDPPMIRTAENLAKKYNLTRQECDEFAVLSHKKAAEAWNKGLFDDHVVPVTVPQRKGDPKVVRVDECVRFDASIEAMSKLRPVLDPEGVVTAGNSSPMNDGASVMIIMTRERAKAMGLEILGKVTAFASIGVDPHIMGIGPVYATRKLFKHTGLTMDDFDLIELNEAFAAQSLPCIRELNIPYEKLNVNGGAIAIGHPNSASGGILVGRLVGEMKRRDAHRGLVTFCCGGGQGFSTVIERD